MTPEIAELILEVQPIREEINHRGGLAVLDAALSLAVFTAAWKVSQMPEIKTDPVFGPTILPVGIAMVAVGMTFAFYNDRKRSIKMRELINRLYENLF